MGSPEFVKAAKDAEESSRRSRMEVDGGSQVLHGTGGLD
jgi:hypothetical protein